VAFLKNRFRLALEPLRGRDKRDRRRGSGGRCGDRLRARRASGTGEGRDYKRRGEKFGGDRFYEISFLN